MPREEIGMITVFRSLSLSLTSVSKVKAQRGAIDSRLELKKKPKESGLLLHALPPFHLSYRRDAGARTIFPWIEMKFIIV